MCTAITMQTLQGDTFFGRTMDFSYPLHPELYIIQKGYEWDNALKTHRIYNRYSFMGIGQDISPVTLADGVNEAGFAAAALYFPGFAEYTPAILRNSSKIQISAVELVNFLLGQCFSAKQAVSLLRSIQIVGTKDSITDSVTPLHWMIADKDGTCMVVEHTSDGLHIMDNPIGILSNSPDFSWHMTNLRNYMNVSPYQEQEKEWNRLILTPFGQGAGTIGLPGDYTPPSRFIRAAYQKSHAAPPNDRKEAIITCFHIMESVSIPKGIVITNRGTSDYTQYTAFIDISAREYYFKTYDNSRIASARLMPDSAPSADILSLGKLVRPAVFENFNK